MTWGFIKWFLLVYSVSLSQIYMSLNEKQDIESTAFSLPLSLTHPLSHLLKLRPLCSCSNGWAGGITVDTSPDPHPREHQWLTVGRWGEQ